jgi:broad-specificity NMP kinase
MPVFTVKVVQFVEEVGEIEVVAASKQDAEAHIKDAIKRGMLEDEHDVVWSDGHGSHHDGVEVVP